MNTTQLFSHVGISTRYEKTRVRFTNNSAREIILLKDGHDDITILALPEDMTKAQATAWIMTQKNTFESLNDRFAIDEAYDRYNTIAAKKSKATIARPSMEDITKRARAQKARIAELA
jgi:hypothetical protein